MAGYTGAAGTNDGNWKGSGGSIGLRTGNTWHGNTAFGPSGGMATGYGTRDALSLRNAGMGPSMGTYSNFKGLNGNAMFGGLLGNQGFRAPNANAAFGQAMAAYQNRQRPVGGVEPAASPITQRPLPPVKQLMPGVPYRPWTDLMDDNWAYTSPGWRQIDGISIPYDPKTSPGFGAYTSVYKSGPAWPNNPNTTNIPKNMPGGMGPYSGNGFNRPRGDNGYMR